MAKRIVQCIFLLLAMLPWLWWTISARIGNRANAIQGISQFLSLFPGKFGSLLRAAFYRMALTNTSQDSVIEFLTTFSHSDVRFGKNFYAGIGCNIGWADIGNDVILGAYVYIASGKHQHAFHDPDTPIREQGGERVKVHIGNDCWICAGSYVFADVGEGSVVAPCSVVTEPVPPFTLVGGTPAKVIRKRKEEKAGT